MTNIFAEELYDYYLTFKLNNEKINLELFKLFTQKLNISNKHELIEIPIKNISINFLGEKFHKCLKDIKYILKQEQYQKITFGSSKSKLVDKLNNEQNIIYNYFYKLINNNCYKMNIFRHFILDNNIQHLDFFNNREIIYELILNYEKKDKLILIKFINFHYQNIGIKKIINEKYINKNKNDKIPNCMANFIIKYNNFNKIVDIIFNHYKSKNLSKNSYDSYLNIIYSFNKLIFEKNIVFHDISCESLIDMYIIRSKQIKKKGLNVLLFLLNLLIEHNFFINITKKLSNLDVNISKMTIDDFKFDIDETKRDYFTDIELSKIIEESKKNIEDELIILLLSHFGFRIGGLRNIHINNIYDFEKNDLKDIGKTLEKGNKIRYFNITLDFELTNCLKRFLKEKPFIIKNKYYLFYSNITDLNLTISCLRNKINNICKNAGIIGSHVHPHAFRKTVVINLMKLGNSIDTVSKFIGHSSSDITRNTYWVETQTDLTDNMIIPWIRTSKNVITLKDIGKLTNNIDIDKASEKSGLSKDFLYFIKDIYQPLKKKCNLLEEQLQLALSLLSEESNKKYLSDEQNIINKINEKYKNIEEDKFSSNMSSSVLDSDDDDD